ncbi:MAG: thermosome subunit alpha [Candidatus Methanoperedens sp.]|jgi:thermosome|nr:thermosome subunit alpha [Candidatus Methanoperedens sp.]PKL54467.1 MAG: thermosome subunit [Candidatus Methanoperedenaceae archaeon HGW-Methanoperedenaceae-1]
MAGQLAGQPIIILDGNKTRTTGKDALGSNITAAKAIATAVKSTLGPKGMDKMLVNPIGDMVITNDGATILRQLDIKHPAAKMMVEIARTQEDKAGDGTTSAVVLAGELLNKAQKMVEQGIHPTTVTRGYSLASVKALEILDGMAIKTSEEHLENIARTALTGKSADLALEPLVQVCVQTAKAIKEGNKVNVKENINIIHQRGGSLKDIKFVHGLVLDKTRAHKNMPRKVTNAKIAVLDIGIEVKKTQMDSKINITSPELLKEARLEESRMVEEKVEALAKSGANVVFTEKGIDDIAMHYLAKKGLYVLRRCKEEEIKKIVKATGARVVSKLDDIEESDLGKAEVVEERGIGNYKMTYIEGCRNPKAVSILIYSGTEQVADEIERALDDALRVVGVVIEDGKIVPGGGAPEIEMSEKLRAYATTVGGREQIAIIAYAEALLEIPKGIAENAGLDAIDVVVELRNEHSKGMVTAGLDVFTGKAIDMVKAGIVEPLRVKTQEIKSATDAANMILRVDDILMAEETGMMDVKPEHTADYYDGIQAPDVGDDF